MQSELASLTQISSFLLSKQAQLQSTLTSIHDRHSVMRSKLMNLDMDGLYKEKDGYHNKVDEALKEMEKIYQQMTGLHEGLKNLNETNSNLLPAGYERTVARLTKQLSVLKKRSLSLSTKLAMLTANLDQSENEVKLQANRISGLSDQISKRERENAEDGSKMEQVEIELKDINEEQKVLQSMNSNKKK